MVIPFVAPIERDADDAGKARAAYAYLNFQRAFTGDQAAVLAKLVSLLTGYDPAGYATVPGDPFKSTDQPASGAVKGRFVLTTKPVEVIVAQPDVAPAIDPFATDGDDDSGEFVILPRTDRSGIADIVDVDLLDDQMNKGFTPTL